MKSEDDMLRELRDSLASYAASKMTMKRVEARDYPLVDLKFYAAMSSRFSSLGFNEVGDFEPITGHSSDGSMRCFIRAFVFQSKPYVAACYHPRPRFWIGLISRLVCGRLGKVFEIETEFSDDTWVISTTAPRLRLFDPPPLMLREHFPETIGVEDLFKIHEERVLAYQAAHPGVAARQVYNAEGLERSQARQHDISTVYRSMVGGLTADEIRRFSLFGKNRAAALKERLSSLQQERQPSQGARDCPDNTGRSNGGAHPSR